MTISVIYYGMDEKYNGCNVVESVVRSVEKPPREREDKRSFGSLFLRFCIAAIAVGVILAVHYVPIAAFDGVRNILHQVFCYDIFGRCDIGSSAFFV